MSIDRAVKFCNSCYGYSEEVKEWKSVGSHIPNDRKDAQQFHYLMLRDNAAEKAMKALEQFEETNVPVYLALEACRDCDFNNTSIINYLSQKRLLETEPE